MSNTTIEAEQSELLQYLANERVSKQWSGFLSVLSGELAAQLNPAEYRALLVRLGHKFSQEHPLPTCATLTDVQAAANTLWAGMQWGYARFTDNGQNLVITHHACPLTAGLGLDGDVAGGFLEGVYSAWVHGAGAPASLTLRQLESNGSRLLMTFELSGS